VCQWEGHLWETKLELGIVEFCHWIFNGHFIIVRVYIPRFFDGRSICIVEYILLGITEFLDFCQSSGILKNTTFRKLGMFPSSGEGKGDSCSGPVITFSSLWRRPQQSRGLPCVYLTMQADSLSETLCSLEYWTMDKVKKIQQSRVVYTIIGTFQNRVYIPRFIYEWHMCSPSPLPSLIKSHQHCYVKSTTYSLTLPYFRSQVPKFPSGFRSHILLIMWFPQSKIPNLISVQNRNLTIMVNLLHNKF
jgi:hypothetical protein